MTGLNWLMNWFKLQKTGPRQFQSGPLNLRDSCGPVMVLVHPFLAKKPDWTRHLNTTIATHYANGITHHSKQTISDAMQAQTMVDIIWDFGKHLLSSFLVLIN
jgi:hypothetical protein